MLSCLYSGLGCVACLRHISVKCDRPLSPALLLALPFSLAPSSGILPERYLSVISTNIFRHPPRSGRWLSNADPGVDPSPRARYGTMWVWPREVAFRSGEEGSSHPSGGSESSSVQRLLLTGTPISTNPTFTESVLVGGLVPVWRRALFSRQLLVPVAPAPLAFCCTIQGCQARVPGVG